MKVTIHLLLISLLISSSLSVANKRRSKINAISQPVDEESEESDSDKPRQLFRLKSTKPVEVSGFQSAVGKRTNRRKLKLEAPENEEESKQFTEIPTSRSKKVAKQSQTLSESLLRSAQLPSSKLSTKLNFAKNGLPDSFHGLKQNRILNPIVSKYLTNFYRQQAIRRNPQFSLIRPLAFNSNNNFLRNTLIQNNNLQSLLKSGTGLSTSEGATIINPAGIQAQSNSLSSYLFNNNLPASNPTGSNNVNNLNQQLNANSFNVASQGNIISNIPPATSRNQHSGVALLLPRLPGQQQDRVVLVPLYGSNPYSTFGQQTYGPMPQTRQGAGNGQIQIQSVSSNYFTTPSPVVQNSQSSIFTFNNQADSSPVPNFLPNGQSTSYNAVNIQTPSSQANFQAPNYLENNEPSLYSSNTNSDTSGNNFGGQTGQSNGNQPSNSYQSASDSIFKNQQSNGYEDSVNGFANYSPSSSSNSYPSYENSYINTDCSYVGGLFLTYYTLKLIM